MRTFEFRTTGSNGVRRGFSPLMLVGILASIAILLGAGVVFVLIPRIASHAAGVAAVNPDCTLIVPPQPLTAKGLATPYQLVATDPAKGPCNEANPTQGAFVQGAVFDPATGQISAYNPLVVDKGAQAAVAPVVPKLPANAVVGLWFGYNGGNLTLKNQNGSLNQGKCVNGVNGSIFGQFAYCNAPAFFKAANQAIKGGKLVPPALGTANDGLACPTVRDFFVVDMDQSDNVTTTYLTTANGQTAQMTAANAAKLQNAQTQVNASDNRLLAVALDGALGCKPWMVTDLADPGATVPSLPLNELQAAQHQAAPVAQIPNRDPMVLLNGNINMQKLNAYRIGVDQAPVANQGLSSTTVYCQNYATIQPKRIMMDANILQNRPSPDAGAANSLLTFLAQRFVASYGAQGLNCTNLLKKPSPIAVQTDGNGVAISATINGQAVPAAGKGNGTGNGTTAPTPTVPAGNGTGNGTTAPTPTVPAGNGTTAPTPTVPTGNGAGAGAGAGTAGAGIGMGMPTQCMLNGNMINNCQATINFNGQPCVLSVKSDANTTQFIISCPNQPAQQMQMPNGQTNQVPQPVAPAQDPNAVPQVGPAN